MTSFTGALAEAKLTGDTDSVEVLQEILSDRKVVSDKIPVCNWLSKDRFTEIVNIMQAAYPISVSSDRYDRLLKIVILALEEQ
jgi:hypothetical protein